MKIISNRYKLIEQLGEGGFGEVWLAEDQTPGRQVALKLYKINGRGHDELVREFNQVFGLDSVNLVKAHHVDRDESQGISYLVMDYCRYGSLSQMVGRINEQEVWRCIRDITSGLMLLAEHTVFDEEQQREIAAPVVHQDLKPANILIRKHDKDGHNVYAIADFGISKTTVSQKSGSSVFVSAGTLAYMGPERFFPSYRPRVESDIWSLGAMLYELVEGKTPFPTMDTLSGGNWLNQEGVELPKIKNSAISSNLSNLIYSCMAKEPENRPTAKQLYDYSDKLLRHENCGDWTDVFKAKQYKKHEGGQSKYEKNHKKNRVSQAGNHNDETNYMTDEEKKYSQEQLRHKVTPPTPNSKPKLIQKLNIFKIFQKSAIYRQFQKLVPEHIDLILIAILIIVIILSMIGSCQRGAHKNTSSVEPSYFAMYDDTLFFFDNGTEYRYEMVYVAGGTFKMGAQKDDPYSDNYDPDAYSIESPVHNVTVNGFYIGQMEVTQFLWQAVMGSNPSYFKGEDRPVENVSWDDCQEFILRLNTLTGETFRLPTEAEWEYAARGGNKSHHCKYAGGNAINEVAWYKENCYDKGSSSPDYATHPVKGKLPNELGLYDMSGNVFEWCSDLYGDYIDSSQTNPTGPSSGSHRVLRGGSWCFDARYCCVAVRFHSSPSDRNYHYGFRLALTK